MLRIGAAQTAASTPEKKALLEKRDALEEQIDKLKYEKAAMPADEYKQAASGSADPIGQDASGAGQMSTHAPLCPQPVGLCPQPIGLCPQPVAFVAHALVRAASPLLATPGSGTERSVRMSANTARTSACATFLLLVLPLAAQTLDECRGLRHHGKLD